MICDQTDHRSDSMITSDHDGECRIQSATAESRVCDQHGGASVERRLRDALDRMSANIGLRARRRALCAPEHALAGEASAAETTAATTEEI